MNKKSTTAGCLLIFTVLTSCWPKNKNPEESELDAITAASRRLFGKNVRGYMWALTTDSPSLFSQAPGALSVSVADKPLFDSVASQMSPEPSSEYFQCWYYAETELYERHDGEGLRKLFLNKEKTKKINNNFIDVRALYQDLERSESLRHLESFALSALPGTCFLFNAIGPLRGKAKGALANAFCSISLGSLGGLRKADSDGWGSDKARQQIQDQLKRQVSALDEVNWEVLVQLKNKVAEFNSTKRTAQTTQSQCPANEDWVAALMGPTQR